MSAPARRLPRPSCFDNQYDHPLPRGGLSMPNPKAGQARLPSERFDRSDQGGDRRVATRRR